MKSLLNATEPLQSLLTVADLKDGQAGVDKKGSVWIRESTGASIIRIDPCDCYTYKNHKRQDHVLKRLLGKDDILTIKF